MSGIYLHIPFCKTRCIYCDFYSTTRAEWQGRYVETLCRELRMRRDYLHGEPVRTLYFGGGTPSRLGEAEFRQIFRTVGEVYGLEQCEEITLEANPDDLTDEYVALLRTLPINRLSMGIQTFDDRLLHLLNRRHTARQAVEAVERCRKAGFDNISIDLIYGLPGETEQRWRQDLEQAVALDVAHLSAYHLTYEEGTRLYDLLREHRVHEADEEESLRFYLLLTERLQAAGYVHYEISNFCRPGLHSRHNSSYWQGVPYLGCGPSAHSFDTRTREWNVASLEAYLKGIESGRRDFEREERDTATCYNERVMTSLRTMWGLDVDRLASDFGPALRDYCLRMADSHLKEGRLEWRDGRLCLTRSGVFVSDSVLTDLMFVD